MRACEGETEGQYVHGRVWEQLGWAWEGVGRSVGWLARDARSGRLGRRLFFECLVLVRFEGLRGRVGRRSIGRKGVVV